MAQSDTRENAPPPLAEPEATCHRLLRTSDRISMNEHGLVEFTVSDETFAVTLEQFKAIVSVVAETEGYINDKTPATA